MALHILTIQAVRIYGADSLRISRLKHTRPAFLLNSRHSCVTSVRTSGGGEFTPAALKLEERGYEEEQGKVQKRMQELAESMVLPNSYLSQLPDDLKRDLKDAAFALSNGPLQRECGDAAGDILMQLSVGWEKGDSQITASASEALRYALPQSDSSRAAIGRRLIAAGRCFNSMGYYSGGQFQKISKALILAGEALYSKAVIESGGPPSVSAVRSFKVGDLQVELTSQKCFIGCAFALAFGALSWGLTSSLQKISESSLQYANDNAVLLATSLRGTLLVLGYSCTALSWFALVGLLALGIQLSNKEHLDV